MCGPLRQDPEFMDGQQNNGGRTDCGVTPMNQGAIVRSIPPQVLYVLQQLADSGFQGYLVGGAPRDILLGRTPTDWDVTTDARPEQVETIFTKTRPTGKRYGTITVMMAEDEVEVTTFRGEGPYSDGRRPDWVQFSAKVEEDLSRRDFTVNAMAYDPLREVWIDLFNGRRDLRWRVVRAIGDPVQRFREDGLRMLRFFRFQSTLDFKGDRRTAQGIVVDWVRNVAWERLREEMNRLLTGVAPGKALRGMAHYGLLQAILPEVAALQGLAQGAYHKFDGFEHTVTAVEAIEPELVLRWAALLHDIGKAWTKTTDERGIHFYGHDAHGAEMARSALRRLTCPRWLVERVEILVRHHMFYAGSDITDAGLRRLVARVGPENILALLELRRADIIASANRYELAWQAFHQFKERVEAFLREERVLSRADLAIGGNDLKEVFGWAPGPKYRETLDDLFQWVLEDPDRNRRETLLEYLRSFPHKNG